LHSIDQKQGAGLKTALHQILKKHTRLDYDDLWYYYRTTDVKADGITIWDMYSDIERYYREPQGSVTSGIQREHSLPKSWWGTSNEVSNYAAYSDLNHLYPADGTANNAKSNYMLGEVANPSFNNGVSKVGKNAYVYSGASTATAFEPDDEYKGDFARTYLYMITCYEDYASQWRSDALNMFEKQTYPVLKPWAKDMLLTWHRGDPVSAKELARNREVYRYQNNRNPFIDLPELVEYIWGNKTGETYELPDDLIGHDPLLSQPVNQSSLYMGATQKNTAVSQTITVKGRYLEGNLSVALSGTNKNYFTLSASTLPAVAVNSDNGYDLTITYRPTEYGQHTASFLIFDGGLSGSVVTYLTGVCSQENGIIPIGANDPDLYVQGKSIFYRLYDPADKVVIVDVQGRVVHRAQGVAFWESCTVSNSGVYIIYLNERPRKVIVY
ncbi:MAG: endonuclease, partial [Dysgonamonadaceae bacterium]|nr:endonuclease [Dysgonamonadaceae bacterium]